ncbi:MAG: signal peptidase I [Candidatus Riflebacteria bacterium]|nr:signal peptidase I [Candidatus Riflebacteria bacterium]
MAATPAQGPIDTLSVWLSLTSTVDLPTLKKNGNAVAARTVRLQGTLAPGFAGDLVLTHEVMGQALSQDRVRDVRDHRFDVKVHLLRGRNTFRLASSKNLDEPYVLDLFHRSTLREWTESIIKALVLVLVVKTFVVQAFFIPTESMQMTLLVGDYLLVDKITYLFRDPRPGEILVFEYPVDPSKDFIKRCVATGGDRIAHLDDRLIVNGKPLNEPYTQYLNVPDHPGSSDHRSFEEFTVKPGTYWMMGDNRNNSQDSRFWGALPHWRLIGKAWCSYWPIHRAGLISHRFGTPGS